MYIGHFAVGLAAKRVSQKLPTSALVLAPVAPDIGAAVFGIFGQDPDFRWTHSPLAAVAWAVGTGLSATAWRGWRPGLVLGILTATHVPLDCVTGGVQIRPHGPYLGLMLMGTHQTLDYVIEVAMMCAAFALYWSTLPTHPRRHWTLLDLPMLAALQVVFSFLM